MVIGIDSLEHQVIINNIDKLPNFKKIMDKSTTSTSESVFPVDTIPAWSTIYTGKHPGNHGLLYSYDVFDPKLDDLRKLELGRLQGNTFWDFVGQAGHRVGVVYPVLAYPSWSVNGFMVSKSPYDSRINEIETEIPLEGYPQNIIDAHGMPRYLNSVWGGHPGKARLIEWSSKAMASLLTEEKNGIELCKTENWDLFFIYFSQLDIIQHRLWRFFDPQDPTYPGDTIYKSIIVDFYVALDRLVGNFSSVNEQAELLVLSDHGHKIRPYNTVNINHVLTKMKLQHEQGQEQMLVGRLKRAILEVSNKLELETALMNFVSLSSKLTSVSKSVYSSSNSIDKSASIAYLSSFAGIKSYPHGGIKLNKEKLSNGEYEIVVKRIIDELGSMKLNDGRPMFIWIRKRDDVFPGFYSKEIFPDILFELQDDYGVGWDNAGKIYGHAYDHNVASGGHHKKAVLLVNSKRRVTKEDIELMDIAPSILDLMGVDWSSHRYDGKSIFEE